MLRRCAAKAARPQILSSINPYPKSRPVLLHFSSSTPNQARNLPQSGSRSRFKPWQRAFLIGLAAGLVTGQIILYSDRQKLKSSFISYKLVKKEPVSSTASIFHLETTTTGEEFKAYQEAWRKGIWNVQFKQPQIQIVRAYTPLPPLDNEKESKQLRFLIRQDPHGEVSSYLHRLPLGADIEMRGPNLEYEIASEIQQVVFFAGGTGIAPALQVANAMFGSHSGKEGDQEQHNQKRKLHILWANRRREDCLGGVSDAPSTDPTPPKATWSGLLSSKKEKPVIPVSDHKGIIVKELEDLKQRYPDQVTVEYFVNAEETWIDEDTVFRTLSRFDDKDFSKGYATPQEQRQILISGPSGFISYLAGPKEWKNGREEQGPVGKIVAHAIAQNPHHVKVWKI